MENKKICWCCIAATEDYIVSCKRLKERMEYLGSKYPVEILITDNIKDRAEMLLKDIPYKVVPYLKFNDNRRYKTTLNKINIWNLTDYDYICFLETDTFILNNVDYIIDSQIINLESNKYDIIFRLKIPHDGLTLMDTFIILTRPSRDYYQKLLQFGISKKLNWGLDDFFFGEFLNNNLDKIGDYKQYLEQISNDIIHIPGNLKPWHSCGPEGLSNLYTIPALEYNKYLDSDKHKMQLKIFAKIANLLWKIGPWVFQPFELIDLANEILQLVISYSKYFQDNNN